MDQNSLVTFACSSFTMFDMSHHSLHRSLLIWFIYLCQKPPLDYLQKTESCSLARLTFVFLVRFIHVFNSNSLLQLHYDSIHADFALNAQTY